MEKNEILKVVKDHFNKVSNMTKEPIATLENEWKEKYEPLDFIDNTYFADIMDPIQSEEWIDVLHDLPNEKAAGYSKISYEMIKYGSSILKEVLTIFLDICLKIENIPNHQWNKAIIYPIPKPGNWKLNLSKFDQLPYWKYHGKFLWKC